MISNMLIKAIYLIVTVSLWVNIPAITANPTKLKTHDLSNLRANSETIRSSKEELTCGYASCPKTEPNKINVHLVAHTHDDVGWLKTVDQYFYGTKKRYANVGVQYILDSVIAELVMDSNKRFIYVEMSFFTKWWEEQDENIRTIVRRLVNEGRLEFINGGWCMNDEATVTYHSTIEQMTLGLKFLNETFGHCGLPRVGWQIDPFGHTNEQASLFAQFGFDGMYFTREGYQDKNWRTAQKSLDLVWHGDRALAGQTGSIFTSVFRDGYDSPPGFCFDALCLDDYIVDNKKSYEYNVDKKGQRFIEYLRDYSTSRKFNHILIPMGGDFHFSAAGQNFKNIDKIIRYVKAFAPDLHIFYSTPSCYQHEIYKQISHDKTVKLPEKFDDFMPYDSTWSVWWSGYFTSRPSVKLVEREVSNLLPVTRMISLSDLIKPFRHEKWFDEVQEHESRCLRYLWEILGDLQHHDAVTGTEKQHVNDDYVRRSHDASVLCAKWVGELRRQKLDDLIHRSSRYGLIKDQVRGLKLEPIYLEDTILCPYLNISQCEALESSTDIRRHLLSSRNQTKARDLAHELETKAVLLSVYNPLARQITQHDIRLPCKGGCNLSKVRVIQLSKNETMKLIKLPLPSGVATLPFRDALTNYEILFYANIPPLGYTSFVIEDLNSEETVDEEKEIDESITIHDANGDRNRARRIRRDAPPEIVEFEMGHDGSGDRHEKRSTPTQQPDKIIVKFDMNAGMIVGLRRANDGSSLNITQKFGYYFPANTMAQPGAYIFRPNTTEPTLIDRPIVYKMFKRKSGALIEIHQKWADWLWQTIRVDAKKNYIEFDYVVGPIPVRGMVGREVVSRYMTSMNNNGVFMTDSSARQMIPRKKYHSNDSVELGGSFYPVVSTIMLKNSDNMTRSSKTVDAIAIMVDRSQAGTSLNEGQLELLLHRRMMRDDNFGVEEALNEPGEDGRGLVTRGRHRLYIKFNEQAATSDARSRLSRPRLIRIPQSPRANLSYERSFRENRFPDAPAHSDATYLVHDPLMNELKQESVKLTMKPVLTFDRLRVTANDFIDMVASDVDSIVKTDLSLMNVSLPNNIHLLTLQPWSMRNNEILMRLENLDNPITLNPYPHTDVFETLLSTYRAFTDGQDPSDICMEAIRPRVEIDLEYLIKGVRIVSLEELNLGADRKLKDEHRLDWTSEHYDKDCDSSIKPTMIKLSPRQIRTFLAHFTFL